MEPWLKTTSTEDDAANVYANQTVLTITNSCKIVFEWLNIQFIYEYLYRRIARLFLARQRMAFLYYYRFANDFEQCINCFFTT